MGELALQQRTAVSKTESLELVLCLVRSSLFQIGYLRGLFPEEEFATKKLSTLENMQVQILIPRRPESRRFIDWIECGAGDALKRQYMKSLYFGISKDPAGCELLEQYHFTVVYGDDAAACQVTTSVDGKKRSPAKILDADCARRELCRTMRMLVTICEHLDDVPEERYIFMKMTYYDCCPEDYEPPFFGPTKSFGHFCRDPVVFNVGSLHTPHHQMRLRCKSLLDKLSDTEDETLSIAIEEENYLAASPSKPQTHSITLKHSHMRQMGTQDRHHPPQSNPAERQTLVTTSEKDNHRSSVKTDHCLSVTSSILPERDVLKEVVTMCKDKTRVTVEDVKMALPDASNNDIHDALNALVKMGSLIPTYRSNTYKVGDLTRIPHALSLSQLDRDRDDGIKAENVNGSLSSLRGNAGGFLAGSERTDSALKSRESRCGNVDRTRNRITHVSPMHSISVRTPSENPSSVRRPSPVDQASKTPHVGQRRKASFVEDPIGNEAPKIKKQRTRIGKMKS